MIAAVARFWMYSAMLLFFLLWKALFGSSDLNLCDSDSRASASLPARSVVVDFIPFDPSTPYLLRTSSLLPGSTSDAFSSLVAGRAEIWNSHDTVASPAAAVFLFPDFLSAYFFEALFLSTALLVDSNLWALAFRFLAEL